MQRSSILPLLGLLVVLGARQAFGIGFRQNPDPSVLAVGTSCEFKDVQHAINSLSSSRNKIYIVGNFSSQQLTFPGHSFPTFMYGGVAACDKTPVGGSSALTGTAPENASGSILLIQGENDLTLT